MPCCQQRFRAGLCGLRPGQSDGFGVLVVAGLKPGEACAECFYNFAEGAARLLDEVPDVSELVCDVAVWVEGSGDDRDLHDSGCECLHRAVV